MKRNALYLIIALVLVVVLASIYRSERSPRPMPTVPAGSPSPRPFSTATPLPTFALSWSGDATCPTGVGTPYPTAETVKAGAIAFVAKDCGQGRMESLWIANEDGSGERQLIPTNDKLQSSPLGYSRLQWSPAGRWLSFVSDDELWLTSRDGAVVRKVLSLADKAKGALYVYAWSPDSSQIAYVQAPTKDAAVRPAIVGILDVESSTIVSSFDFEFPYPVSVTWMPNGKSLLLNSPTSFVVVDPTSGETIQEMTPDPDMICDTPHWFDSLRLAPGGRWFALLQHGNGIGGHSSFCIVGLDGKLPYLNQGAVSSPVWDSTGEVAYFTAADLQPWARGDYDPHGRLMRFNVRTRELQFLMPLETKQHEWIWSLSISPDGQKLEVHSATRDHKKETFLIIENIRSFSDVQYTLDLQDQIGDLRGTAWAANSQDLILLALTGCPMVGCAESYYALFAMDVHAGAIRPVSGQHWIQAWTVSPR